MHGALQQVLEFHKKFHKPIGDPANPELADVAFRMRLIDEEYAELKLALRGVDKTGKALTKQEQMIAVFDALLDLQYVILGAGVCWGLDLGFGFDEVHRSNMTKTSENKRADGKVMKGKNFVAPDLGRIIQEIKDEFTAVAPEDREAMLGWPEPTEKTEKAWKAEPDININIKSIEAASEDPDKFILEMTRVLGEVNTGWRPGDV